MGENKLQVGWRKVDSFLKGEANEMSDKYLNKIEILSKAALGVLDKATTAVDRFIEENPKFISGAMEIAGGLVLPAIVVASIPEVVHMIEVHAPHGPFGLEQFVTMAGVMATNAFVFNEGVKNVTGKSLFTGEAVDLQNE